MSICFVTWWGLLMFCKNPNLIQIHLNWTEHSTGSNVLSKNSQTSERVLLEVDERRVNEFREKDGFQYCFPYRFRHLWSEYHTDIVASKKVFAYFLPLWWVALHNWQVMYIIVVVFGAIRKALETNKKTRGKKCWCTFECGKKFGPGSGTVCPKRGNMVQSCVLYLTLMTESQFHALTSNPLSFTVITYHCTIAVL